MSPAYRSFTRALRAVACLVMLTLGAAVPVFAQQAATGVPSSAPVPMTVTVGRQVEFDLVQPLELSVTGASSGSEVIVVVGPDYSTPVRVTVGSAVISVTDSERPAVLILRSGDTVRLDADRQARIQATALTPRYVGVPFRESGDLGPSRAVATSGRTEYMTAFVVEGAPRQWITIDMTSEEIDSYLMGSAPDRLMTQDDDGGDGLNSRLALQLDRSGRAAVIAMSLGREAGRYELTIASGRRIESDSGTSGSASASGSASGGTTSADAASPDSAAAYLPLGLSVSGAITSQNSVAGLGYAMRYQLPVESGQSYRIDLTSSDMDSYLIVRAPDGRDYVDDDSGDGYDSMLTFTAHSTGTAIVTVTSYSRRETGRYTIGVGSSATPRPAAQSGIGLPVQRSVSVGPGTSRVSGAVGAGEATFSLDVRSAGSLSIEVVVTAIHRGTRYEDDDTMLFLFDGSGHLLDSDDDGGEGMASLISGVRVRPGTYYAVVTTYPNRPDTASDGRLQGFDSDGGSNIEFDLRIELE